MIVHKKKIADKSFFTAASLLSGTFPIFLEVFFPILRPWSAKVINESFVGRDKLRGTAVRTIDDRTLHTAFDECVSRFFIIRTGLPSPGRHDVKRPDESLGIVESRFDCKSFPVRARSEHLDHLQLVAEFEHRVGQGPRDDVRRPRHKGISDRKSTRLNSS